MLNAAIVVENPKGRFIGRLPVGLFAVLYHFPFDDRPLPIISCERDLVLPFRLFFLCRITKSNAHRYIWISSRSK
jgi:hypothetical protein